MCANRAQYHKFVPREESKSPTITMYGLLDTMVIDAHKGGKVATFDVPGLYLQTYLPKYKFTLLLLEDKFVDIICEINTEYKHYVRTKDGEIILYLCTPKAIYGMIESALLWYDLYMSVFMDMGIQINTYYMLVANK